MGISQRQIIAGLAFLAIALDGVTARPSAHSPDEPVKLNQEKPSVPDDKGPVKAAAATTPADSALLASLPQTLPEDSPEEVPVVIADQTLPEAMVVVADPGERRRLWGRAARTHLPAEARDADGIDGNAFPYVEPSPVNDPAVFTKHAVMSRTLPRRQEDPSTLDSYEENVAKKMRRHRVLFRSDEPIQERHLDARASDEASRKVVPAGYPIQHSPVSHSYEVREPGRETIVLTRPAMPQSDPEDKQPKLQLIRHIHHQQFGVPFFNQNWSSQNSFANQPTGANAPGVSIMPPVFNSPSSEKQGPITGYFPFVVNDARLLNGAGLGQSITDVFEYGHAPVPCNEKQTRTARLVRKTRAVVAPIEDLTPLVSTTTETPAETTVLPEFREVGKLAGPVVQSISQDDDEDKVPTTIVLGEGGGVDEDGDDDDDDEADDALDEDDDEEEEEAAAPTSPNKGGFQKKLKDKLNKIEKKVRKRVKNAQQNLQGLRKQVNRHVTEIVMHSEGGGLEEAGPIVSKLVVRRGGVAIAGPGGIATAGFGGTAIVGPGGTAYTSPDSLAVAGPGARVISVPSSKLQEMFDSFRKANGRNIEAFKPSWLGTIPPDGKLVATGPVVFFNPPEQAVPGISLS